MVDDSSVRKAWSLYKQGRFSVALESLEPQIFQNRENSSFFQILGLSCLRLGDWKGGETYLKRSLQLEDSPHRDTLLGLMAVAARQRDYSEAVRMGLMILDNDPQNKIAKKALDRLRLALGAPEGSTGLDKQTLGRWLPPFRQSNPRFMTWLIRILIGLVLLSGLGAGTWWGITLATGFQPPTKGRPGPEGIAFSGASGDFVQVGTGFAVTLSSDEVRSAWDRAQKAFQAYQDSRARYEINRLLLSNASASVKERARALIPFLHEPDFARPEDSSSYREVRISPALYEGCTVRWVGVVSNLVSGEKKITFDLLLGYQDGQVVEGIVPVELGFAALLKNSQVIEVLGRVLLRDGQWLIQGTSLREQGFRVP